MYAISNEYKQIIYSGDAQNKLKLLFNGVEYTNVGRTSETLKVTSKILSNGNTRFSLDNFVSKEAELIIHDIDLEDIKEPINISIGTLVNNAYEYVPIGVFKLDTAPTTDNGKTTIKMRDYSTNFDIPYDASSVIEANGGSATMLQILQDICTKCDIELGTTTFTNMDTQVSVWDNSINARVYIMYIAEKAGCIATMSREGKLILVDLQKGEDIEAEIQNALYINNALARNINLEELQGNTIQDGTPTPDSPVEIQKVTGEQNVNIYGQQLFDYTDTRQVASEITVDEDGWITATYDNSQGTGTKYLQYYVNKIDLQVNTPYKIITEIKNVSGTGSLNVVSTSTTNGQFITSISYQLDTLSAGDIKVDTSTTRDSFPAISYGTRTVVRFNAGTSGSVTFRLTVMSNVEVTPETFVYKTYQGKDYEINLNNIELNKIGNYQDYIKKSTGKNLFDKSTITIGYINADGSITTNQSYATSDFIEIDSSLTYSKTATNSPRVKLYDKDKNLISTESISDISSFGNAGTYTIPYENAKYIRFTTRVDQEPSSIDKVMFVVGDTIPTEYEPYLPKETWYIEKQIGKVVLNGSEHWNYNDANQVYVVPDLVEYLRSGFVPYSNYYIGQNITQYSQLNNNSIAFLQSTTQNRLLIKNPNYTGVTAFKNWLSTHNTIVYYVLATPTYTEITDGELISQLNALNKAKLNYGVNSITITSNNLNMGLKIAYQSIKEPFELNTRLFEKYKAGEKLEISRVVYEDAIRKFESGTEDKGTLYINTANPYITSQEEIENVYDMINGLAIYSMNISKMRGNPAIDPWDLLKFTYNNQEYIFLGQNVLTFTGNVMQSFDTQIGSNAKTQENVTLNAEASQFKRIFTRIDQAEGNIELNASQISSVQTNLQENYYTLEQTNQLILNAQTGLTNTFSEAGGNNIFRNTGLWFTQTDSNNPYEFWTGIVDKVREEKSASTNALLLQNTTLVQEQDVPNGNYTISFKYKKLIAASQVKCIINDVEYTLINTDDTEFMQTIEVNSQHINIKFVSNINNSCEIYDLMVNAGAVKLAYSQNQNETTTDTVNISKGITITSSEIDTTFKANADGVRIYDSKDLTNPKTKFTDKGTETDYINVKNEAEIVNILIQKVGNHTWFTKI